MTIMIYQNKKINKYLLINAFKLPQKIWIFDTDNLSPLFTILHTCLDDLILPLYSSDERHLAVVSAGYEEGIYRQRVNISKCPEKVQEDHQNRAPTANIMDVNECVNFIVEVSRQY